jgi:hypothetical protein
MNEISDIKTRIDEKVNEHQTYLIDSENQQSLLKQNNDVKELKIRELEHNLIELDKKYCQKRMYLERQVMDTNNEIVSCEKELDSA